MSAFDKAAATLAAATDKEGVEVTYTPSTGGFPKSVKAVFGQIDPSIMDDTTPGNYLSVIIKYTDVLTPQKGDTLLIKEPMKGGVSSAYGDTWHVIKNNGGGQFTGSWELIVSRSARRMA